MPRIPGNGSRGGGSGAPRRAPFSIPGAAPTALCPHFGPCGGCSLLDVAYGEQLARKREGIESALREALPGVEVAVDPVLPDPRPFHYRNKAIYPLGLRAERGGGGAGGEPRLVAGFYRRRSHAIVDVRRCDIQEPALTAVANRMRQAIERSATTIYDERTGKGLLRHLFLRLGTGTGEMMVAFVTSAGLFPQARVLAEEARRAARGLRTTSGLPVRTISVLRNINRQATNAILGSRTVPLFGRSHLRDRLGSLDLRVSLESFYQVNPRMALATYDLVRALAGDRARGRVVDAYSGIGTLALFLAPAASEVIGIEENPAAVADAVSNARSNGARATFVEARVEGALGRVEGAVDLLVLDPPRGGCAAGALEAASSIRPRAIVYVSCNPRTLARDLARLARTHAISRVRPVDLFPQTEHVEVVALLERRREG